MAHASREAQAGVEISPPQIVELLREARRRTLALIDDLSDEQMIGPRLAIVNPPLWEIGHVAWTQEFWLLRHLYKRRPLLEGGDALYNSTEVAHDSRWELRLPSRGQTLGYMDAVLTAVADCLHSRPPEAEHRYFPLLALFHEDMHAEALAYTRQTLGYPPPKLDAEYEPSRNPDGGALPGDVEIPSGAFVLGAPRDLPFVFDNEKWAHPVELKPFRIARAPVTNGEFAAFIDDGGYRRRQWWSEEGWRWLEAGGSPALERSFSKFFGREQKSADATRAGRAEHPVYWRRDGGRWMQRLYDAYVPLRENLPVIHVNWYEADAFCRWANRRLPTEAEWEMAAAWDPARGVKRLFPWGDEPPSPQQANLDGAASGLIEVGALAEGESAFGCRQMIGNVWEWTATEFGPYPGFVPDPYKEYSAPWFGTHKVLRGGCWATRARLIRNTWRNFYTPDRCDVWAGFRTCAA